jgi:hypothetical protein
MSIAWRTPSKSIAPHRAPNDADVDAQVAADAFDEFPAVLASRTALVATATTCSHCQRCASA